MKYYYISLIFALFAIAYVNSETEDSKLVNREDKNDEKDINIANERQSRQYGNFRRINFGRNSEMVRPQTRTLSSKLQMLMGQKTPAPPTEEPTTTTTTGPAPQPMPPTSPTMPSPSPPPDTNMPSPSPESPTMSPSPPPPASSSSSDGGGDDGDDSDNDTDSPTDSPTDTATCIPPSC